MNIESLLAQTANLTAEETEELISLLAERRAHMEPPVPFSAPEPGKGGKNHSVQSEPYLTYRRHRNGGMRMWIRSGGLGWMIYDLTKGQTEFLYHWITHSGIEISAGSDLFSQDLLEGKEPN